MNRMGPIVISKPPDAASPREGAHDWLAICGAIFEAICEAIRGVTCGAAALAQLKHLCIHLTVGLRVVAVARHRFFIDQPLQPRHDLRA